MRKMLCRLLFIAMAAGVLPVAIPDAQAGLFQMFLGHGSVNDHSQGRETGTEVRAMFVDQGTTLESLREQALLEIGEFRQQNPDQTIEISILLNNDGPPGDDGNRQSIELATAIQTADQNTRSFRFEPTDHLKHHVRDIPDHRNLIFSHAANQRLRKFQTSIVAVRTIQAGLAMGLVLFIANDLPWQAAMAGGLGAAAMSGELMRQDDHINAWLGARSFWDPSGNLTGPDGKAIFKALNVATPYIRHGALVTGYLTVVHWLTVAAGAPPEHYFAPTSWMFQMASLAAVSAVSSGQWRQVQKTLFNRAMTENNITNFADFEAGVQGAMANKMKSWTAAVVISLVSTVIDALNLGTKTQDLALYLNVTVGVTGGLTLTYICTDFPAFIKSSLAKLKQTATDIARSGRNRIASAYHAFASNCANTFQPPRGPNEVDGD